MFVDVGLVMASGLAGGVTGGPRTFPAPSSARPGASLPLSQNLLA